MTAEASCREGLSATEQWAPELRSDWTLVPQDPDRLGEAQSLRAMEKGGGRDRVLLLPFGQTWPIDTACTWVKWVPRFAAFAPRSSWEGLFPFLPSTSASPIQDWESRS